MFSNDGLKFIKQIKLIIEAAESMESGTMTLSQDNNVVSAKSLLDFWSLTVEEPALLIIQGKIDNKYLKIFESWNIK